MKFVTVYRNLNQISEFEWILVDFRDFNDSLDYMLMLWLGYAYVIVVFVCECLSSIIWLGYIIKMSQSEQHKQQQSKQQNEEAQQQNEEAQ
jgi:hypothetical protein